MPALYISNPTHQHRQFCYRLPDDPTMRFLEIPAGQQVQFPKALEGAALQRLLDQLRSAGGREFNESHPVDRPFCMLYRVGRQPIEDVDLINESRALDVERRQDVAGDMVDAAGSVTFDAAQKTRAKGQIESATLEVVEEDGKGGDAKGGVDFEMTVSRKAGRPQRTRRRG